LDGGRLMNVEPQRSTVAYVSPTEIPGLVDVHLETGVEYRDLTMGQLRTPSEREGWELRPALSTR
jgi:hypothetical protein